MRPSGWNFNYTARDLMVLGALGVLAGVTNIGLYQLWQAALPGQWTLNSALIQGAMAWAYLLAYYLVRKPGTLLAIGALETSVRVLLGNAHGVQLLGWGLTQGLAAEVVMALTGYRGVHVLIFMLAGAAATHAHTFWTLRLYPQSATPEIFQNYWLTSPMYLLSGALLSGALGYGVGRLITRPGFLQLTPSNSGG